MLSALLAALAVPAPPFFIGYLAELQPSTETRFDPLGFASDGQLLMKQTFMDTKFYLVSRVKAFYLDPTFQGNKVSAIRVEDGLVKGTSRSSASRTVVVAWRRGEWQQISPRSLYYASEAFLSPSGLVVSYGQESVTSPFSVYFQEAARLRKLSGSFSQNGLKLHGVRDDHSVLISSLGSSVKRKFQLVRQSSVDTLGSIDDTGNFSVSSIPGREEVIVDLSTDSFSGEKAGSLILSGGTSKTVLGPSGRPLKGVRANSNGWLVGTEGSIFALEGDRAVLVIDGQPYYLDSLLENKESLKSRLGFQGGLNQAVDIHEDGTIAACGLVKISNGVLAKSVILVRPKPVSAQSLNRQFAKAVERVE